MPFCLAFDAYRLWRSPPIGRQLGVGPTPARIRMPEFDQAQAEGVGKPSRDKAAMAPVAIRRWRLETQQRWHPAAGEVPEVSEHTGGIEFCELGHVEAKIFGRSDAVEPRSRRQW
jgi:hypothetical protein